MPREITLEVLQKKVSSINSRFGTELSLERLNGKIRVCTDERQSSNLTILDTKANTWQYLDVYERGLETKRKWECPVCLMQIPLPYEHLAESGVPWCSSCNKEMVLKKG